MKQLHPDKAYTRYTHLIAIQRAALSTSTNRPLLWTTSQASALCSIIASCSHVYTSYMACARRTAALSWFALCGGLRQPTSTFAVVNRPSHWVLKTQHTIPYYLKNTVGVLPFAHQSTQSVPSTLRVLTTHFTLQGTRPILRNLTLYRQSDS